jgi:hypothetical protein
MTTTYKQKHCKAMHTNIIYPKGTCPFGRAHYSLFIIHSHYFCGAEQ